MKYRQSNLWEAVMPDPIPIIKSAMKEALRTCALSREQVVDEMNSLASISGLTTNGRGQKITVSLLDKWVAPNARNHVIPLKFLAIFCKVTDSALPLQALAGLIGVSVITEEEERILSWAKLEIEKRKLRKKAKKLAQEVGIE